MALSSGYIFLSYSRRDTDFQKRIVTYLRGRGLTVWVDNEQLIPGTPIWESEIEKAITGASAILVLLSPDSKNSEWVRREITFAEQNHKRIFPVLVRGDEDSSMTLRLITRQYVDLRKNEKAGLQSLYQSLNDYLVELEEQKQSALVAKLAKSETVERASREEAQRLAAENAAREESRRMASEKEAKEKAERDNKEKTRREELERNTAEKRAQEREEKETRALAKAKQAKKQKEKSEQFWKTNKKFILPGFAVIVLLVIGSVIIPHLSFGKKGVAVTTEPVITSTKQPTVIPTRTISPSKTPAPSATSTSTPTLLPTPGGQLVFEDTFEKENIQISGFGYSIVDDGTGNKILRTKGDTAYFDFGPNQFKYGTIEFNFRFHDEGETFTKDGTWLVNLNILRSASKSIILSTRPMVNRLSIEYRTPLDWIDLTSTTDFNFHAEQWYTLQVQITEATIVVYANNDLVLHCSNDQDLVGSLGMDIYAVCAAANQCPPAAEFDFDNIRVWMP
jgi:hypothetical protein